MQHRRQRPTRDVAFHRKERSVNTPTIRVHAGRHDRAQTLITWELPDDIRIGERGLALRAPDGTLISLQISVDERGRRAAHAILPRLAAGQNEQFAVEPAER